VQRDWPGAVVALCGGHSCWNPSPGQNVPPAGHASDQRCASSQKKPAEGWSSHWHPPGPHETQAAPSDQLPASHRAHAALPPATRHAIIWL